MIEMIVAISIISVSLLGILILVNRALGVNRLIAEQYTATYLASEGIELVKNMFDHSFKVAAAALPGSKDFYGWVDPSVPNASSCPALSTNCLQTGIYEVDYADQALRPTSCSSIGIPTKQAVRNLFIIGTSSYCNSLSYLDFDSGNGSFRYNAGANPTKFKRVIIIDWPPEYTPPLFPVATNLDYRVTSAVEWESKGGKFTVQLEDYFLPWRIP